jgi:ADP-ribosyl-[dinitrogen reductase] hydrolase
MSVEAQADGAATDRAAGVLLGQACGDALGVPYEFGARPGPAGPKMVGGGLGPYEPGEWSDDTQMAICIARVSASGADLTSEAALDDIAEGFLDWQQNGATDIGNQTRRVLGAARRGRGRPGARLREAAREDLAGSPHNAGNGALMRTSIVGLTRLDDRRATADSAQAVAALTHPAPDVVDTCVLWSEAVRRAAVDGELDLLGGLDLLPDERRDRWRGLIEAAEVQPLSSFTPNGWTVTAMQAAWGALQQARRSAPAGSEMWEVFSAAIGIGDDTDTVAAIAGGLAGAFWGAGALAEEWVAAVHGWPGMTAVDLRQLAVATAEMGSR